MVLRKVYASAGHKLGLQTSAAIFSRALISSAVSEQMTAAVDCGASTCEGSRREPRPAMRPSR